MKAPSTSRLISRLVTSLAAIAAVSVIFAARATDVIVEARAEERAAARLAGLE